MKILFVSRKGKTDVGGLARFYTELTKRFSESSSISPPFISWRRVPTFAKASVARLSRAFPQENPPFDRLRAGKGNPFLGIPPARATYHSGGSAFVEVIHLCDATLLPFGFALKKILRKPLTLTGHGLDLTHDNYFYQKMLRLLLPKVDGLVLDSDPARNLVKNFKVKDSKIRIIPPGISVEHFRNAEPVALPNLKGNTVLLTIGNLVARKGHAWFATEIMPKLSKDFIWLIVGRGKERRKLLKIIRKLRLQDTIFLLGKRTDREIAYIYRHSHIYVCPNIHLPRDFEGFGIALGEAALMGLPVIASDVDGISSVIRQRRNGLLIERGNVEKWKRALNHYSEKKVRDRFGMQAKLYTQRYVTWNIAARNYQSFFQEVIYRTR